MASISELACIYSALILHNDEVTVTEDKINVLIKAAGVNVEPFLPSLFAKVLANVNIGSLICNVGAGGPAPSIAAVPAEEKKVEAKKEQSEESNDNMGFGLFD
ncbi:PREDICTED: 60S acidic ribosomal protein P1-like isoform X1 [Chrysochloris asiatica]|uniref:Large ribosomal subunit protein P1 n=1 Tax=Chrysochloris asiatica TaxID=185453 RepID=A0A9B0WLG4_CHRAS|nr:PREDICTED: 60S acidic ribosomal protein P1-like isoform X1 [Chrysochloris asiatica]